MKPKIKKLKTKFEVYEITYEFEGEKVKRKVTLKDDEFYECDGFITSKELKHLKGIIDEYL